MSRIRKIEPIAKLPKSALKPKIIRVAAYARVSTNDTDQLNSLEAQVDYYEKKVKENKEWLLVGIYADEGKTGTSYFQRKEFLRMIEDCKQGKIDMIVTKSISRFARNTVDALNYIRLLKEMDIGVHFERENIWTLDSKGEFLITLLTSLAQEEARSISENTTWGIRKNLADGKYSIGYSHFLGYDKGANKHEFVINEEQALVVRLIYRMYLQGYSTYKIALFLTEWEIATPAGKDRWQPSSVMSILRNEKYKGDALLQKTFTADFLTKKRKPNNGELPQYYVQDGHDAIIDRGVFDYVQTVIDSRLNDGKRYSGCSLYSSFFRCGKCGSWYGPKPEHSNNKYRRVILMCLNRFRKPYYCKNTRINIKQVPQIYAEIAKRMWKKYPSIKNISYDILHELSISADLIISPDYEMDLQDISMVVTSATVYPNNTVKIKLIDGSRMTIHT